VEILVVCILNFELLIIWPEAGVRGLNILQSVEPKNQNFVHFKLSKTGYYWYLVTSRDCIQ
jgi:hypothetical protein